MLIKCGYAFSFGQFRRPQQTGGRKLFIAFEACYRFVMKDINEELMEQLDEKLLDLMAFILEADRKDFDFDIGYKLTNVAIAQLMDYMIHTFVSDCDELKAYYQHLMFQLLDVGIEVQHETTSLH
ncbi:MAG: hypothetical protein AAGA30_04085 [Planctomycetota bacterium]